MARSDKNKAKLREELDGITTLNLFLNSANILEKLLWVTIAVLGTLFIYDIVFAQWTYWQLHPGVTSVARKKLAKIEPPAITLCSSGLQNYGFFERIVNHIDPNNVPYELLAIRNEGLTLEFLDFWIKPSLSEKGADYGSNFCKLKETFEGWMLDMYQKANYECQAFEINLMIFSLRNGMEMAKINALIFEEIANGKTFNLSKSFDQVLDLFKRARHSNIDINASKMDNFARRLLEIQPQKAICSIDCECNRIRVYNETTKNWPERGEVFGDYDKSLEKVNGYSFFVSEDYNGQYGIWFCIISNSWIIGLSKERGQCTGYAYFSRNESCLECLPSWGWRQYYYGWRFFSNANRLRTKCLTNGGNLDQETQNYNLSIITNVHLKKASTNNLKDLDLREDYKRWLGKIDPSMDKKTQKVTEGQLIYLSEILFLFMKTRISPDYYNPKRIGTFTNNLIYKIWKSDHKDLCSLSNEENNANDTKEIKDDKAADLYNDGKLPYCKYVDTNFNNEEKNCIKKKLSNLKDVTCNAFWADKQSKKVSNNYRLRKLMTTKESEINLLLAIKSLGLNDFSNILLEPDFPWRTCIQQVMENQFKLNNIDQDLFFQLKRSVVSLETSPCNDLGTFPTCKEYCQFQQNLTKSLTKQEMHTMMRFGLPQNSFQAEPWHATERKLAEMLFGNESLRENLQNIRSPVPLPLFCRNNKLQLSQGNNISAELAKFCNEFQPIITDVGICMAKDSVFEIDLLDMKVKAQTNAKPVRQALRFAETTILISNGDVFDSADSVRDPFLRMTPRIKKYSSFNKIQLQIQQNVDIPQILYGSNQQDAHKSLKLNPGYEYIIKLSPRGQITDAGFQDLTLEQRKCRLKHEILEGATTSIYSKQNCKYDCHVSLAIESCQCIPWDFISNETEVQACDLFGRTCFLSKIANLTHSPVDICPQCIDECDDMEFKKEIVEVKSLELSESVNALNESQFCNEYVCIDLLGTFCYNSSTLCDFVMDTNNVILDSAIDDITWEDDYNKTKEAEWTFPVLVGKRFKKMQTLMKTSIVLRIIYDSSLVDVVTLDARTTFSDKIANLGGTYGIWAEFTGCSLLGIIHLLIIIFKIMMQKFAK